MKNNEYKVLSSLVYFLTREQIQEEAENVLDRKLTRTEMEEFRFKISEKMIWVLQDTIQEIADFTELEGRNIGKKKINPRYEIFWKNDNEYQPDFIFTLAFKDEEDARSYVRAHYDSPGDEYKIMEINGDAVKTVVHHKNSLNGGDGFHMDVHAEPKVPQNAENETF